MERDGGSGGGGSSVRRESRVGGGGESDSDDERAIARRLAGLKRAGFQSALQRYKAQKLDGGAQQPPRPSPGLAASAVSSSARPAGDRGHASRARGGVQDGDSPSSDGDCDSTHAVQGAMRFVTPSPLESGEESQGTVEVLSEDGWHPCGMGHEVRSGPEGRRQAREPGNQQPGVLIGTAGRRDIVVGGGDTGVPLQERAFYYAKSSSGPTAVVVERDISSTAVVYLAIWGLGVWQDQLCQYLSDRGLGQAFAFFSPRPRSRGKNVVFGDDLGAPDGGHGRVSSVDTLAAQAMSGAFDSPNYRGVQGGLGQFYLVCSGDNLAHEPVGVLLPFGGGRPDSSRAEGGRTFGVPSPPIPPRAFSDFPGGVFIICNALAGWCCRSRDYGQCTECARREALGHASGPGKR